MYASTRLPLQTGATMLRRVVIISACLVVPWAAVGRATAEPREVSFEDIGKKPDADYIGLCAIYWFSLFPITAAILMFTLGAARASDCFLDTDELRIDGGKYDGFRIGWSAIVASHSRVDYEGVLWLNLGEISVPIAVAVDDDERHSLGVMVQAIRSRETERSGAIVPRPPVVDAHLQIAVIVCPSCGAPSGIDDVPQVRCHDCGVAVPVSDEMRSRIRAARDLRRDRGTIDALVEKLLNQPTASRVNGMLVALAALMIWWLPLPAMVHRWSWMAVTCALGLVLGALANAVIADRRAVRLVTLDFAARASNEEGGADRCRRCGAPLPPAVDGGIVVSCVYCTAENVLGVDVRDGERETRSAATSLEEALHDRKRARWRARLMVVASFAIAGAGVWQLR